MIYYKRVVAPIGELTVYALGDELVALSFGGEDDYKKRARLQKILKKELSEGLNPAADKACEQLLEYFKAKRQSFDVKLNTFTRGFALDVSKTLEKVPYGHTVSYAELAAAAGHPGAFRAAGTALALNPLPIFLPCHRIISSDGKLSGYAGGIEAKRFLLKLENL